MKIVDLHQDLAYSNQMGRDVIEEEQKQSSIKMLRNFDSLIFGSIFPHIDTLNDKSHKLSNLPLR